MHDIRKKVVFEFLGKMMYNNYNLTLLKFPILKRELLIDYLIRR